MSPPTLAARRRRDCLTLAAGAALGALWPQQACAQAGMPELVLATPGPASSVSLIPELAVKIGADRAEGIALRLKFVSGGGVAIQDLYSGNAQLAVFGAPAAMKENLERPRLVALAAIEDRAPLAIVVHSDLRSRVRRVADLRGRVVGVTSNALSSRTTGQQFLELLLREAGVPPAEVRLMAAGQSLDTQSNALRSKLADAIVSEEPFATRLVQQGIGQVLVRTGHVGSAAKLPGIGFLRGTLIAERRLVTERPDLAERAVRAMQRTLAWRQAQPVEAIVDALGLFGAERAAFAAMLRDYPRQFSTDGRFSDEQIAQTDTFFHASAQDLPAAGRYSLASMVMDTWAGRKP
jgi:NitT/TauT family transport system substrate-binding protein